MKRFGSHPTMKMVLSMKDSRIRVSPRYGGLGWVHGISLP